MATARHAPRPDLRAARRIQRKEGVNVWGAISRHGLGPLHRVQGALTAAKYCHIPGHDFLFQQDLAPVHTARSVQAHLYQTGIEKLAWVPKEADLNIIENLWAAVLAEWQRLASDTSLVTALYESLPSRMSAVVEVQAACRHY
ncbi:hypothetical protein HPB48_022655 [Haemaphysalis longicornis]|uniref:Tc1-like transposase DDE domain-containing protein n=1 Tax=Haemaphysalis longicornis TaxID=44386 RepID=A0A9J6GTN3_HAELO|nr:hypothetical protein HPB48_022655 [Haemaphysalis longicornis]